MKILIIAPSWLGDLTMAISLFKAIKNKYKNSTIDICIPNNFDIIAKRINEIDDVIDYPLVSGELGIKKRYQLAQKIKNRYDWAIILPITLKSALLPFFAKIKKRTGYLGECRFGLINDIIKGNPKSSKKINQTQQQIYLNLIGMSLNALSDEQKSSLLPSLKIDQINQKKIIKTHHIDSNKKTIGFAMGSNYGKVKQWPIKNYAKLAKKLIKDKNQIILFGSAKEKPLAQKFITYLKKQNIQITNNEIIDLIGELKLTDSIDLLAACDLLVTNDSGLMHIANATKTKVVVIYGSTSPKFAPCLNHNEIDSQIFAPKNLDCAPCVQKKCTNPNQLECLKQTKAQAVFAILNRMIL